MWVCGVTVGNIHSFIKTRYEVYLTWTSSRGFENTPYCSWGLGFSIVIAYIDFIAGSYSLCSLPWLLIFSSDHPALYSSHGCTKLWRLWDSSQCRAPYFQLLVLLKCCQRRSALRTVMPDMTAQTCNSEDDIQIFLCSAIIWAR